jgi:sec-independent protein translocase protein TatC
MHDPGSDAAEPRLIDHLIELRARLLRAIAGLLVVFLVLLPFGPQLFDWLAQPLIATLAAGQKLVPTEATSGFSAVVKLAFFAALTLTMPWLLYQAWAFVAPGLYRHEKRLAMPILGSAVALFYAGCAFAFFLVVPGMFTFLQRFSPDAVGTNSDPVKYLDLVTVVFIAFGASFELPVVLVILVLLGWVTPAQLREWRGYAVVGIFVVAAIITPPDVISQLMLAIPMCLLYEVGILAARWIRPREGTPGDGTPGDGMPGDSTPRAD